MPFAIGQKVQCIIDMRPLIKGRYLAMVEKYGVVIPEKGKVYRVRHIYSHRGIVGITLMEIVNPAMAENFNKEPYWYYRHFVPIEDKKASTETGFKILDDVRRGASVPEPVTPRVKEKTDA
jgi:hypothetical protein